MAQMWQYDANMGKIERKVITLNHCLYKYIDIHDLIALKIDVALWYGDCIYFPIISPHNLINLQVQLN